MTGQHPQRSAAIGLWTAVALFTAVVASRRVAGAYLGPLSTPALIMAVILAGSASVAALWLFRQNQPRTDDKPADWLPEITAWGLPTLFSLVIAARATPGQGGALLGVAVLGAVALGVAVLETTHWWPSMLMSLSAAEFDPTEAVATPGHHAAGAIRGSAGASSSPNDIEVKSEAEGEEWHDERDESTTQWMTRRDEPDGEAIEGTVRVHFAAGQREAVVHVTFCPPLPSLPEVELECVDGEDWQIKTEAALPYGIRIQVRRSKAVTIEQSGRIAYLATSCGRSKAA